MSDEVVVVSSPDVASLTALPPIPLLSVLKKHNMLRCMYKLNSHAYLSERTGDISRSTTPATVFSLSPELSISSLLEGTGTGRWDCTAKPSHRDDSDILGICTGKKTHYNDGARKQNL